jgi:hypothetical protein
MRWVLARPMPPGRKITDYRGFKRRYILAERAIIGKENN